MRRYFAVIFVLFLAPFVASAALVRESDVIAWDGDTAMWTKDAFAGIRGAMAGSLVVGNLDSNDAEEIVVGAGQGMEPLISVLRADGTRKFRFSAFPVKMRQGVEVVLGDLDGDGVKEIIAGQKFGGSSTVRIFNNFGVAKYRGFNDLIIKQSFDAFGDDSTSGVSLATLDVDADGRDEIIAAEGPRGSGAVRIFRYDGTLLGSFTPFDTTISSHGLVVTAFLDTNGNHLLAVGEASKGSHIALFRSNELQNAQHAFTAFGDSFVGGVHLSHGTRDGKTALIVSVAGAGTSVVKYFSLDGELMKQRTVYEEAYTGGVLAAQTTSSDGAQRLLTIGTMPLYTLDKAEGKYSEVDLQAQRMYNWDDGYLARTYLVSTGLKKTPTPVGEFSILTKPLFVNYTRIYGPDDPRNYSFPNTRWNLMFKPHYYIHTAWWHSNFGRPMSHGCINTYTHDAEWLFGWAPMGMKVSVVATLNPAPAAVASTQK